jgi:glycosyltransferase involved in cell wall biosynthesis
MENTGQRRRGTCAISDLKLVCLLPVRNGEADLPGYLQAVEGMADAVVALDDGSTDATRQILEASPLVKLVLHNPPRADYVGWDDAGNRNRLLDAAAILEPDWVLSLDADERIPPADAAALRAFLETDALAGLAYGFKVYRMWQDLEHYDQAGLWVYRLFAYKPGQRFPEQRLHFVPIPTEIPRPRWVRTTIRIQHLAGLTIDRRQARFDKYQQADPDNTFQHSYRDLLRPALDIADWKTRPAGLPILDVRPTDVTATREDAEHPELDQITGRPALSAIIISRAEGEQLLRSVASVVDQECPWPFEVIVVTSGGGNGAALVRERFPDVTLVELPQPALPGEARNAGLRLARGEYVSFPGSHVELPPGSLAARLRAHDLGYAMVTGTTLNGTRTWAGWASYFLDQSAVLPGRSSTELDGAPSHCSYRRTALLAIGGFPEDLRSGEDTVVNQALVRHGYQAYRAQDVVLIHHSPCRTPWKLVTHHFVRGRGLGRILRDRDRIDPKGLIGKRGVNFVRRQVPGRVKQTTQHVRQWSGDPALEAEYRRARPLVFAGATAACAGALYEIAFRQTHQPSSQQPIDVTSVQSGLLPQHRVVAFYGHPRSAAMGILGQHEMETVLSKLRQQAAAYAAADPTCPVIPAFDLIVTVAQPTPGTDGAYRLRTGVHLIDAYAAFTAAHNLELILDVQPGHADVAGEIEALRPWLVQPHVHLALDPEWLMDEGQVPGPRAGTIEEDVLIAAQEALGRIVRAHDLPPKMLIVHQFLARMIEPKRRLDSVPGVQLVVDINGAGAPRDKIKTYHALIRDNPGEFAGFKLFYTQDQPLMTASQVVALNPTPHLIIYQ